MITVIPATEDDWTTILDLLRAFLDAVHEDTLDPVGCDRLRGAMREGRIRFYLARERGEPVGISSLTTGFSTYRAAPIGILDDLYVVPTMRGKGVARQLVQTLLADAEKRGCRSVMLGSGPRDLAMYQHWGFRPIGTLLARDLRRKEKTP